MRSEAEGRGIYSRPRAHFFTDRQRKVNDSFIIFFLLVFFLPLFRQWRGKKNQDRYQYCKKLVTRIRLGPLWCLKNDELANSWRIILQFGWRQTLHFVKLNSRHPEYTCMGWSRWGEIDCLKAQRCNYLQQRGGEGQRSVLPSNGCYWMTFLPRPAGLCKQMVPVGCLKKKTW